MNKPILIVILLLMLVEKFCSEKHVNVVIQWSFTVYGILARHPDKTCFSVCGSKDFKQKAERDLQTSQLKFDTFQVTQRISNKYLGQTLHSGGVECSAEATVKVRVGRIKGATMEIKSIVEEYQMQALGLDVCQGALGESAYPKSVQRGRDMVG